MSGQDGHADTGAGVCQECGATGQIDVFCDSCGVALRGHALDTTPVDQSSGMQDVLTLAPLAPELESDPPEVSTSVTVAAVHSRARELLVPVADAAVPDHGIVPVAPGMPLPARPTVHTPTAWEVTEGLPCPWCSIPNPVDRHFCRRCAMSLATRPAPARLPWWRRMWLWISGRRHRESPYAGQRPRLRRGIARAARWTVAAVVVVVLVVEIDAHSAPAVLDVEDHFAKPVQVFATTTAASHSDPAHPYRNLSDGYDNTWWGTGLQGDSAGVYVQATFAQPVNLLDVIITPGAGIEEDTFTRQSRPETLDVALYKPDGESTQTTVTFNDSPGPQSFAIRGEDVARIRFTIESAYLADVPGQPSEVAISEIEFFVRSSAH